MFFFIWFLLIDFYGISNGYIFLDVYRFIILVIVFGDL